jgi:hypothetical protein
VALTVFAEIGPFLPSERSLPVLVGWFGMGPVLAAALLWAVAGRKLFNSDNLNLENEGAEQTGRSFGLLLGGAYLFIWSGIEAVPSDGHEAMQSIAQLIP